MGDVVNLRSVRKAKARDAKSKDADANRAKHGQTKAGKQRTKLEAARAAQQLDGHKLET